MSKTLSLAPKSIESVEATRSYQPLAYSQLSDTFNSRLAKWWEKLAKQHEFEFDASSLSDDAEDYGVAVDDLPHGQDFILDLFQPNYGPSSGGVVVTLGELANTLQNEHAVQFTINAAKVEAIGKDAKLGLFKTNSFIMPIEVTYLADQLGDEDATAEDMAEVLMTYGHMGGGRHRLTFWLTVTQCIEGWEDLNILVFPRMFETVELQSLYIMASNGSRTMTPTEKSVVEASAANVNIDDIDSLFTAAETNSSMWSKAAQLVSVNLWDEFMGETELADAKLNTRGKFGSSVLTAAKKHIASFGMMGELDDDGKQLKNEDTKGLVGLLRRREVFEGFMEGALSTFASNFKALKGLAKSETGGYNYARFMSNIASAIAEALVDDALIEQLEAIAEQDAQAKREKARKREQAKKENAKKKQLNIAKQAKAMGMEQLRALMAQLEEEEESDDEDDSEYAEDIETIMVDEDDDEEEQELTPPPSARKRSARVSRRKS